jgi:hypothetical protein
MRSFQLLVAAFALGAMAAACGDRAEPANDIAETPDGVADTAPVPDPPDAAEPEPPGEPRAPEEAEEPWITHQPRMEELRRRTPQEFGWSPGTTDWVRSRRPIPDRLTESYVRDHGGPRSPGDAMAVLAREVYVLDELHVEGRQEVTVRATTEADDRATGVLLYWGALDDAIAGSDIRAVLRYVDGSWYVERLEERFHCRRGVTDGLCV